MPQTLTRMSSTIGISAAGGYVAHLLNLPAAWLMGGSLAVAVAALSHPFTPPSVSPLTR